MVNRLFGGLVIGYAIVAAAPKPFAPWLDASMELIGFTLLCAAAFGRVWCLTFAAGNKDWILLTEGPYSVVRNPLYLFSVVGAIGFGLVTENLWLVCVLVAYCAFNYPITVAREERHLRAIFGSDYVAYSQRVPRWFPKFRLYRDPERFVLHPARVRRSILYSTGYLWGYLLWDALEKLRALGPLHQWH